jgi:hypothetical protein
MGPPEENQDPAIEMIIVRFPLDAALFLAWTRNWSVESSREKLLVSPAVRD